jgi:hypothetical protein
MNDIKGEIKKNEAMVTFADSTEQIASFFIRATAVTLVLLLIVFLWHLAIKNSLSKTESRINEVEEELKNYATVEKNLQEFQGAIKNINEAMQQKKEYAFVFQEIANVMPKEMKISSISLDKNGKLSIEGSVPSLSSLARVLVAFPHNKEKPTEANPVFRNVSLTSFSFSSGGVSFGLSATVAPKEVK